MSWLVAQLLRDPEQSEDLLLDEYYRRLFQTAAAPMRRFFRTLRRAMDATAGPPYCSNTIAEIEAQSALFRSTLVYGGRGHGVARVAQRAPEMPGRVRIKARVALGLRAFALIRSALWAFL